MTIYWDESLFLFLMIRPAYSYYYDIQVLEEMFMGQIIVQKNVGGIDGLFVIVPSVHGDQRGYFMESYNLRDMIDEGLGMTFVQDNQSGSIKGVLRGLHYQKEHPQGKLVRVIRGEVFDVAVDLRKDSETFGKSYGIYLSESNRKQFYIPEGFAHGFLVLSDTVEFFYKCTDFYFPGDEGGILWSDPELGIDWPIKRRNQDIKRNSSSFASGLIESDDFCLSDGTPVKLNIKDQNQPTFRDFCKTII